MFIVRSITGPLLKHVLSCYKKESCKGKVGHIHVSELVRHIYSIVKFIFIKMTKDL